MKELFAIIILVAGCQVEAPQYPEVVRQHNMEEEFDVSQRVLYQLYYLCAFSQLDSTNSAKLLQSTFEFDGFVEKSGISFLSFKVPPLLKDFPSQFNCFTYNRVGFVNGVPTYFEAYEGPRFSFENSEIIFHQFPKEMLELIKSDTIELSPFLKEEIKAD